MATDSLTDMSGRRPFLTAPDEAVRKRGGMSCGIVTRGGTPVLYLINTESPSRFTEIGAANAPAATADMIVRAVDAHLRACP
jgi:hypothetical protein